MGVVCRAMRDHGGCQGCDPVVAAVNGFPSPASEEALVRGALAGDNDCWSALIARHNHKVVVALLAHGVPMDQAKELEQETWLRLLQQQRAARLLELKLPGLAIVQARFRTIPIIPWGTDLGKVKTPARDSPWSRPGRPGDCDSLCLRAGGTGRMRSRSAAATPGALWPAR